MESLKGKIVLITGASSGIGAATATLFASYGCKLSITARRQNRLEEVANECKNYGLTDNEILTIVADLSKKSDLDTIMNKTIEKFNGLDILINNAGMPSATMLIENLNMDHLDKVMSVNFKAPLYLSYLAIPYLKNSKGSILNCSSIASKVCFPSSFGYGVTKAALDYLMRTMALELGPFGIRVNSVCPGHVRTEILEQLGRSKEQSDKYMDSIAEKYPMRRVGESEDIAKAFAFLASDSAAFISGSSLIVDGAATTVPNASLM